MKYTIEEHKPGLWVVYVPGRLDAVDINFPTMSDAVAFLQTIAFTR
jgi:hypothetical protein